MSVPLRKDQSSLFRVQRWLVLVQAVRHEVPESQRPRLVALAAQTIEGSQAAQELRAAIDLATELDDPRLDGPIASLPSRVESMAVNRPSPQEIAAIRQRVRDYAGRKIVIQ